MNHFDVYIALGDSMSIDLYPALDAGLAEDAPVGAAALLYSNINNLWPDFAGNDLASRNPNIEFVNLAEDGATTFDWLDQSWLRLVEKYKNAAALITLTLGGNDALQLLRQDTHDPSRITTQVATIVERYKRVVNYLKQEFPKATVVLTTVYDPSDGTGNLPGLPNFSHLIPFLRFINDQIKDTAKIHGALCADAHASFMGRGAGTPPDICCYWPSSPIEPSALGASELRRLWLTVLEES